MTNRPLFNRAVLLVAGALLLVNAGGAFAQDALSRAKGLYESADYEQALQLLETVKGKSRNAEAAAYQVFCLVALGRNDEARAAIEAIVRTDPLYRPSDAQVSPRIRSFFDEVRKPLLPEVVRESYSRGKASFQAKEWAPALSEFNRVIALIDEMENPDEGAVDLRTLAAGFRDLARVSLEPPPAPKPPPDPTPEPPVPPLLVPMEPVIYGGDDRDVKGPVALSKKMPEWRPIGAAEELTKFSGALEVIVSEHGIVLSATLLKSVHPRYDGPLLEAARSWTFKPATLNGVPVRYRYSVAIQLGR